MGEADRLWGFATRLFENRDFYRALGEYQRFVFFFPSDARLAEAELQIGRCYRKGGKLDKAFEQFVHLFNRCVEEAAGRSALLEMLAIREEQQCVSEAIYWAERFVGQYPNDPELGSIYLHLAWLQLDSGAYREAQATLERIAPESDQYPAARALIRGLQDGSREEKSPRLAGILAAVLPGAGHLYAGNWGQAVTSLALNGLFIGAAAAAFACESPILGGVLVFFELGWYQGGIRSAATAAREANVQQEEEYRRHLERTSGPLVGFSPAAEWTKVPAHRDLRSGPHKRES
jgi:tetratricopeptide (TPR) repeat protein